MCALRRVAVIRCQLGGSETSIDDTLRGSETSIEGTLPGAAVDEFVAHFTLLQRLIIFILYNKGYPILKYKW